jgi:hypothetical protein
MLFPHFAQTAAALVLLIIGFAAPAHAQNNKQVISGTYYEDRASTSTSVNATSVALTFTQTPANQFMNITNVSCSAQTANPQIVQAWILELGSTPGGSDLGRFYVLQGGVPEPEAAADGSKWYSAVVNQMFYKVGSGRFPSITVLAPSNGSTSLSVGCVIVGTLTDK